MTALLRKAMPDPIRSASPRAALLSVLAALLLAGCGGARSADSMAAESPAPREGPMRVGEVTLESNAGRLASTASTGTGAASADPTAPPPPLDGSDTDGDGEGTPAETKTTGGPAKPSERTQGSRVQGAVVESAGGLSEAEVRSTIVQQQTVFQSCYEIGASSSAGAFSGVVTLRATIGPTGTVASVDVVQSSTKNVRVDGCVADAVRRIQFPAKGGGAVVGIPIEFGR